VSYEENTVDKAHYPESISRQASSFRYSFIDPEVLKLSGKAEWREDKNSSNGQTIRHLYFEDRAHYRMTEDLSLIFKGGLGYATNLSSDADYFDFTELSTGFAYRPIDFSRLNTLGRYTFIHEMPLATKTDFIELMDAYRHVLSFEGGYDLTASVQMTGKVAYRKMREKVGARDWQDSDTWLFLTGFLYEFTKEWFLTTEYRILRNETSDDQKQGVLCDVRRRISDLVFISAGYNFTDFDDDLTNSDSYDCHGFFVRIVGRY
jgi:hypothetical protein